MSFPRYPEYKDSGVEWLGEVPATWNLYTVKRGFMRKKELNTGMRCENRLSLTMRGVVPRDLDDLDGLQASEFETYQVFHEGDLAFKLIDLQNIKTSRVGLVPETGIMSPAYIRLEPNRNRVSPRFGYWFFTDLYNRKIFNQLGGGVRQTIGPEELGTLPFPLVPLHDQVAIATFLDHETAKIDALVAEQERLIALLKEKRQAVISHAVTKGLEPGAPMKDSGIEWLGEVPAHWEVARIKWVARMESGHTPDKKVEAYWTDCDIPWVSLNDTGYLKDHDYIAETAHNINDLGIANSSARLLPPEVVVFSRDATIGRCAITTRPMAVSQHFIAWVCSDRIRPEFLLRVLRSMTQELERLTFGATVKTIGMPDVRTLVTSVPPTAEQDKIISHIRRISADLDSAIRDAETLVGLLKERRSALISAAVTGKIDVRGWVADRMAA